jgi:hypothetical protein
LELGFESLIASLTSLDLQLTENNCANINNHSKKKIRTEAILYYLLKFTVSKMELVVTVGTGSKEPCI